MKTRLAHWKKGRRRPDPPIEQLDLAELIIKFNRATIGKAGKRKEKDKDRHYLALSDKPISPNGQAWNVHQLYRFLSAKKKVPPTINAEILAWEAVTGLSPNQEAARELADFLLREIQLFGEVRRWYDYYTSIRGRNNPITQLFVERMQSLASSDEDRRLIPESV